jgi:hypothetical protein
MSDPHPDQERDHSVTRIVGDWRSPAQMLDDQQYDGHASVHDGDTAAKLGLIGAPIEGPTHFSQFDPLALHTFGPDWFEHGCISAHFQTMVIAGEDVQAVMVPTSDNGATIEAHKRDGTPVLVGTASVGPDHPESELHRRLAALGDPGELFIIDRLAIGMHSSTGDVVSMSHDESNGALYPFSLTQKLAHITEPHAWYTAEGAGSSPWGRPVVPMEMISVLAMKSGTSVPVRTPSLGLFLDLEIRLHDGPVFVDEPYTIDREVVGLGQSRKTESYWTRTTLTDRDGRLVATVLLHSGVFKASYPDYPQDRLA